MTRKSPGTGIMEPMGCQLRSPSSCGYIYYIPISLSTEYLLYPSIRPIFPILETIPSHPQRNIQQLWLVRDGGFPRLAASRGTWLHSRSLKGSIELQWRYNTLIYYRDIYWYIIYKNGCTCLSMHRWHILPKVARLVSGADNRWPRDLPMELDLLSPPGVSP